MAKKIGTWVVACLVCVAGTVVALSLLNEQISIREKLGLQPPPPTVQTKPIP